MIPQFFRACIKGDVEYLEDLFEKYKVFDVNFQNLSGNTLLHLACKKGFLDVANLLIQNRANIFILNHQGKSPFDLVCEFNHSQFVYIEKFQSFYLHFQNAQGNTPLHIACLYNSVDVVEELLETGAEVNVKNIKGNTPLHIACENNNLNIAGLLINHGGSIEEQNKSKKYPRDLTNNENILELMGF
jgi:ankyrin repeat protein